MFGAAGLPRDEIAALQTHPQFEAACRATANGMVELYEGNRLLNTVVNDRGRLVIGYLTLYLHFGTQDDDPRSGLTLSRLKTICVEQDICSAGRAEAMVAVMRLFGYLEPAPDAADRRVRRLVPTEKLIATYQQRWERVMAALGQIRPEGSPAVAAIRRLEFVSALVRQFTEHFLSGVRILDHSPELELFTDRNAGLMVLFSLLLNSCDDGFAPTRPVTVSISALSRRFGVSRVHVRKMLRDAAEEGFIARPKGDDGPIVVQPRLTQATHTFLATIFLFLAHCIGAALEDIGPPQTHS
jgi:DNA-binding MarR family transcriptional regulator